MKPSTFAKGNKRTLAKLKVLRKQAQADRAPRVALRIQGIMLSLEKYSVSHIAHLLQMRRSSVHMWIACWNEYGEQGLYEGHRSGRPAALSQADRDRLGDIVESGPVAYGLQTGVWTSPIIAGVIEEEFAVRYHLRIPMNPIRVMCASCSRKWAFPCSARPRASCKPIPKNRTSGRATPIPT